ncbi:mucin-associated surface protein (MASP) [Trypanosoma cruzi]|nr:mucin-associated surface protein (MASP) [Trypanosoma cruzi]
MVCVHYRCWAAAICGCAVAVRGVAAVSILLLPLCVDVLLFCAEGYTQVTGVMAMMMTGRVLLVCALCVLWCGACGGYAWFYKECGSGEESCINSNQYKGLYNSSFRSSFLGETNSASGKIDSSTGSTGNGGDRARSGADGTKGSAGHAPSGGSESPPAPSQPASNTPGDRSASNEPSDTSEEDPDSAVTLGSGGGGGPNTVVGTQLAVGGDLASDHQTPEDGDTDPDVSHAASEDGEDTHSPPTSPPDKKTEEPKVTKEGEEGTKNTREEAPAVLTTKEESEGNPEAEPGNEQRSSANGVSEQQPEAAQQGETEDGNTTEKTPTPATVAAAQAGATRTPDESDGSTAASHTTSPLFLFFLRVRLLLRWWPRESEGERAVHRPHTNSSFSLSVCVPLHGISPSPQPNKHTHNLFTYL